MGKLKLPRLKNLSPTLESTMLKLIEESGELARSVLAFLAYEHLSPDELSKDIMGLKTLGEVSGELLDVAQTCVTMIFVVEDNFQIRMEELIESHLAKLRDKGYDYDPTDHYYIISNHNYKYIHLPRLFMKDVTLLKTACKIQEELGEAGQFWGKGNAQSGETNRLPSGEVLRGYCLELLDIAQCCFTMMYILEQRYNVDLDRLVAGHIAKLQQKGYC